MYICFLHQNQIMYSRTPVSTLNTTKGPDDLNINANAREVSLFEEPIQLYLQEQHFKHLLGFATSPPPGSLAFSAYDRNLQPVQSAPVPDYNNQSTASDSSGYGGGGSGSATGYFPSGPLSPSRRVRGVFQPTKLKTAISLLNEVCAKAQINPEYDTKEEGPPHDKVFECTVKLERQGRAWSGSGKSKSKRDAKQEAAKALLLSMDENIDRLLVPTKPVENSKAPAVSIDCDPEVEGNPIGDLNDMCLKAKQPPPQYEDVGEEGKPHERTYIISCKLGSSICESGRGKSKKSAKKVAALKAKQRLTESLLATVSKEGDVTDSTPSNLITNKTNPPVTQLRELNISKNETPFKLEEWFEGFRKRAGLSVLQQPNNKISSTCPTKVLREIADEQKLNVQYLDIVNTDDDVDNEDRHSSIVSILGTEPAAIFVGSGGTKTQARKSAASAALKFLKLAEKQPISDA